MQKNEIKTTAENDDYPVEKSFDWVINGLLETNDEVAFLQKLSENQLDFLDRYWYEKPIARVLKQGKKTPPNA